MTRPAIDPAARPARRVVFVSHRRRLPRRPGRPRLAANARRFNEGCDARLAGRVDNAGLSGIWGAGKTTAGRAVPSPEPTVGLDQPTDEGMDQSALSLFSLPGLWHNLDTGTGRGAEWERPDDDTSNRVGGRQGVGSCRMVIMTTPDKEIATGSRAAGCWFPVATPPVAVDTLRVRCRAYVALTLEQILSSTAIGIFWLARTIMQPRHLDPHAAQLEKARRPDRRAAPIGTDHVLVCPRL